MAPSITFGSHNGEPGPDLSKPKILVCASPAEGHTNPVLKVVQELVQRGYDVTMIAGDQFKEQITSMGAEFVSVPEYENIEALFQLLSRTTDPMERLATVVSEMFVEPTGHRMSVLYAILEKLKIRSPTREIVILTESLYLGHQPMYLGAPLPRGFVKRPRIVNLNAWCNFMRSRDTPPSGLGITPEESDGIREVYRRAYESLIKREFASSIALQEKVLSELGAQNFEPGWPFDVMTSAADMTLQMCPPSLEFKRSDLHPRIRFVGALGRCTPTGKFTPPDFWKHVTRGDKQVVVVTQGTVANRYDQLLIPTLRALGGRSDLVVVGILGHKGGQLPAGTVVPTNVHIVDYLSYDVVLPYASVFVSNAGYGGLIHGLVNGVPMVLAGKSEDKAEVAARGQYAGIAIDLNTSEPSEEQIRGAVDEILNTDRYVRRAKELQLENENMRAMDAVEKALFGED